VPVDHIGIGINEVTEEVELSLIQGAADLEGRNGSAAGPLRWCRGPPGR
jgi:hypothetical protein